MHAYNQSLTYNTETNRKKKHKTYYYTNVNIDFAITLTAVGLK